MQFRLSVFAPLGCVLGLLLMLAGPAAAQAPEGLEPHADAPAAAAGEVMRVGVVGTQRIEEATVLATVSLRRGDTVTADRIREDLRAVYATGFFDDVRVEVIPERDGVAVVFHVEEKPAVRAVRIVGQNRIDEDDIREVLDIRAFSVLNEADIRANVERIRDLYLEEGFYLAEIDPQIAFVDDDQVEITFQITENRKVLIQRIDITGNEHVPDARIKRFMQTKTAGIVPWLTSRGAYQPELLEQDLYTMRFVFMEEGFVNVQIDPPQVYLSPDNRYIYITINVDEGEQYEIGDILVEGDFIPEEGLTREAALEIAGGRAVASIQEEQWREATGRPGPLLDLGFEQRSAALEEGDVFQYTTLQQVVQNLSLFYQDQGYAFANVVPFPDTNPETGRVNLRFQIDTGQKVRIGNIHITGNDPTFDKVVRRELLPNEGDIFRGSLLEASRARLMRLGYFDDIQMSTPRGEDPDTLDLNVRVNEQPTGSFSLGLGYSNLESVVLTGNVSKNNFLGLGYTMGAAINWSRLRQQWNLSLFDPYFLDSRWTLKIDGFNVTRRFQLDEYQRGGSLSIGRYLDRRDDVRLTVDYTFEDVGLLALAPDKQRMMGGDLYRNGFTSSLGLSFTIDKRDNRIRPTEGFYAAASVELAGGFRVGKDHVLSLLGGDFNFVQSQLNFRFFQPLIPDSDLLVFRLNSTLGMVQSTDGRIVPFIHRFRAGGINSVRGYDWFSLGPRIRAPASDDPLRGDESIVIGGTQTWINNFEIEVPIVRPAGITGVVFFDAGNAFGDPWGGGMIDPRGLRFAYGIGVRWQSPMGPLRFEYGIPINPREGERPAVFDFSIGSFF